VGWLPGLLVVALVFMAGCTPRAGSGEIAETAGESELVLDVPAIALTFNEQGNPSLGAVPLSTLADAFAPGALDAVVLDAETIDMLMSNNIQHIQINNRPDGLSILVNGLAMPSLSWDSESLATAAETASLLGDDLPPLGELLPLAQQLGVGVVARFPVAEGAEEIPLTGGDAEAAAADVAEAQQAFTEGVESAPVLDIPVFYEADGSWTVNGLTDTEYGAILPQVPWQSLRLPPEVIQGLVDAGVSEITVATSEQGLSLAINGNPLPHISWESGELQNVIELAGQMGLLDTLAQADMDPAEVVTVVESLIPVVQAANIDITANFPDTAGE
jgi:hypothetical protein